MILAGLRGPVFLVASNFDVIKTYNDSTAYALSVALLGDAVKGGRPLQAQWPTHDPQLSEAQVRRLQAKLKTLGYDAGEIILRCALAHRKRVGRGRLIAVAHMPKILPP